MNKKLNQHKLTIIPKYGDYYYPTSKVFEDDKGDIVYYGESNEFPQYVIELFNKSSVNGTAIMAKRDGIVANGLTAEDESILDKAIQHENYTIEFYRSLADKSIVGSIKQAFFALALEEESHIAHLQEFKEQGTFSG